MRESSARFKRPSRAEARVPSTLPFFAAQKKPTEVSGALFTPRSWLSAPRLCDAARSVPSPPTVTTRSWGPSTSVRGPTKTSKSAPSFSSASRTSRTVSSWSSWVRRMRFTEGSPFARRRVTCSSCCSSTSVRYDVRFTRTRTRFFFTRSPRSDEARALSSSHASVRRVRGREPPAKEGRSSERPSRAASRLLRAR
jgi:hypothetical protein